jgi:hypothetical protein
MENLRCSTCIMCSKRAICSFYINSSRHIGDTRGWSHI